MSSRTIGITDELARYLSEVGCREPEVLVRLRRETASLPEAPMQITPEQGQLMRLLVELLGARRTLEIGVFTGYSALSVALGLPPEGRILACDVSETWTRIARRYFQEAGVEEKLDLRIGPAVTTLDTLIAEGRAANFDFAFIDADKSSYDAYYERCLVLVRPGGLIAIDNALWGGAILDGTRQDADTQAIRTLGTKVHADERVTMSLVPIGDGLLLARKR